MSKPDTVPVARATPGERFRYWFDGIMSKGMIALIGLLALAIVVVIAVVSLVITIFGLRSGGAQSYDETFWSSLMHALDSGTLGGDDGNGLRAAELVVTIGGIIVVANRKAGRYHIVGEIRDGANMDAARLVGRDEADWVLTDDLISRITVQTSRQSGLSVVYTELLDFGGDEIYFSEQPGLAGKSFLETQLAFRDSAVIGVLAGSAVHLNPPAGRVHAAGEQLIVIAEDDSTVRLAAPGAPDETAISAAPPRLDQSERVLMLGRNNSVPSMLEELDQYVGAGSTVTVVAEAGGPEFGAYKNLTVTFVPGDTANRVLLESLRVHEFEHIIVLAGKDDLDAHRADARTLITLLHLRDMATRLGVDLNVVSEMLDDRNRELAEVTQADDFIVSDKLISLMLSQISENDRLSEVFQQLFSSAGSEIYLRPADSYVKPGRTVDFYTVLAAAAGRGQTAIGYRIAADKRDKQRAYGIVVNPDKGEQLTFAPGDMVIVLAED